MVRYLVLACLIAVASSATARAGTPDPVALNAPQDGASYRLGEPLRNIGPAPYTNAKKYDCTITQGSVRWHRESATPTFEMSVADVNKFKPGPAVVAARVFFHNAWLPAAKATFTFAPSASAAAKHVAGSKHYDKTEVATAMAEAHDKWKSECGCNVAMSVDDSSLSANGPVGGNATFKITHTFGVVAISAGPDVCKDDESKKKICAHLSGVVVAEVRDGSMGGTCQSDDKHVVTCTFGMGYGGDVLPAIGMTQDDTGYHW
jgi:hypothetical protein